MNNYKINTKTCYLTNKSSQPNPGQPGSILSTIIFGNKSCTIIFGNNSTRLNSKVESTEVHQRCKNSYTIESDLVDQEHFGYVNNV